MVMKRKTSSVMPRTRSTSARVCGSGRERDDGVDAFGFLLDLVGQLLLAPLVDAGDVAFALLDGGAKTLHDLLLALLVRVRVHDEHELILVDRDHLLWSARPQPRMLEQG